jgi:hypothetical protein
MENLVIFGHEGNALNGITYEYPQTVLKEVVKVLNPDGLCEFSDFKSDLPVFEAEDAEDGFSYEEFDYDSEMSWLKYQSCTGSKVNIFLTNENLLHLQYENIGSTTFRKLFEAFQAACVYVDEIPRLIPTVEEVREDDRQRVAEWIDENTNDYPALVKVFSGESVHMPYSRGK